MQDAVAAFLQQKRATDLHPAQVAIGKAQAAAAGSEATTAAATAAHAESIQALKQAQLDKENALLQVNIATATGKSPSEIAEAKANAAKATTAAETAAKLAQPAIDRATAEATTAQRKNMPTFETADTSDLGNGVLQTVLNKSIGAAAGQPGAIPGGNAISNFRGYRPLSPTRPVAVKIPTGQLDANGTPITRTALVTPNKDGTMNYAPVDANTPAGILNPTASQTGLGGQPQQTQPAFPPPAPTALTNPPPPAATDGTTPSAATIPRVQANNPGVPTTPAAPAVGGAPSAGKIHAFDPAKASASLRGQKVGSTFRQGGKLLKKLSDNQVQEVPDPDSTPTPGGAVTPPDVSALPTGD